MKYIYFSLLCLFLTVPALAQNDKVETRMLDISTELRCLVCQNETIAASRSDFAIDIRKIISTQIEAGKSNDEIRTFLVERFGDYILYRPPLKITTLFLWFGPLLLLLGSLSVLLITLKRRNQTPVATSLNKEEKEKVEALLQQHT